MSWKGQFTKQEYTQPEKLSFQLTNYRAHFILQFHITEESISQLSTGEVENLQSM